MPMQDYDYWFRIADEDRKGIQNLSSTQGPWRLVVFLAQATAEKYLKGFLAFHDQEPDRIHDMDKLLAKCRIFDPSLEILVEDCGNLSPFSVEARYPEFEGIYDETAARLAIATCDRICNAIRARIIP